MTRPVTARQTALIEQGIKHHNARRFVEAERAYQTVLRENPEHPDALNLMGVLAVEASQYRIALDYMGKAVKLAPAQAIYRNNLGNALIISLRAEEAVPHLEKAVTLDATYADAWTNLGKAWRQIGNIEKAEKHLRKALAVTPGFVSAQVGLAEIQSEMGQFEEARSAFSRILLLDPRNVSALCGLAGTQKFAAGDPLIDNFERMLRDPTLRDDERAPLHHSFGKICNDLGRYEEAFLHYTRGKELKKLKFHMELHRQTYEATRELFTLGFFAERKDFGLPDSRPVFIVGMPRSGTTLTEQILASHHAIEALGELPYLGRIVRGLSFGSPDPKAFAAKVAALSAADVADLATTYIKALGRAPDTALRIVDKSPHNYELLGLIALMFPNAGIVHCRRSPLDNCIAVYLQNFNEAHGYNGDLATLGGYYREYRKLMDHWHDVLPLKLLDFDYEETVADIERAARTLIDHLGLDWDDNCLHYFEQKRQVTTPSRWQVRQPIYDSSIGRWKNYEKFLDPLKTALGQG